MLKKKTKGGGLTIPDFKVYYRAVIITTVWYWHKNRTHRSMEQNREPRSGPQMYDQLIFNKAGKSIQWKKDSIFSKWRCENWKVTCKRMKLDQFLTPYTKINSNWEKT